MNRKKFEKLYVGNCINFGGLEVEQNLTLGIINKLKQMFE